MGPIEAENHGALCVCKGCCASRLVMLAMQQQKQQDGETIMEAQRAAKAANKARKAVPIPKPASKLDRVLAARGMR